MNNGWKITGWIILGIIALSALSIVVRSCNTANEVANKKVFNSDHIIYTYEDFHKKYQQYQQYEKQLADAQSSMDALKAGGITSGQEYDNLAMEISGIRNMKNRIASDYNAMTEINWDNVWKEKGLPEKLE